MHSVPLLIELVPDVLDSTSRPSWTPDKLDMLINLPRSTSDDRVVMMIEP
jgi:hypothetical protein